MTNALRVSGMMALGVPNAQANFLDLNFASVGVSTQAGTSYTFAATDAGGWVRFTNGSAVAASIPTNATVPISVGTVLTIEQAGAGQVTIGGAGVTVNTPTTAKTNAQYSVVSAVKVGVNEWTLIGDLAAS